MWRNRERRGGEALVKVKNLQKFHGEENSYRGFGPLVHVEFPEDDEGEETESPLREKLVSSR